MRRKATARTISMLAALVAAAVVLIVCAGSAGATSYHSCASVIPSGGQPATHIRAKRTNCRTARLVLRRQGNRPGWHCVTGRQLSPRVVCKHAGGKVIRAIYVE